MIPTDYYKFERIATKAKHRMDCVASTKSYPLFEQLRKTKAQRQTEYRDAFDVGALLLYWGDPEGHMRSDRKRQADRSITMGSGNISSVYNYKSCEDHSFSYGDAKGTKDALLFIHHVEEIDGIIQDGSWIEIFVVRGKSNECNALCNLFEEGMLDEDLEALRCQAVTKSVTTEQAAAKV